MVITIELWLGAVFILIAVAGIRMTARWLPRAVLVAGAVALLGLAAINPERLIAERNIDRYQQTGHVGHRISPSPVARRRAGPAAAAGVDAGLCAIPRRRPGCLVRVQPVPVARRHEGTPAGDGCAVYW